MLQSSALCTEASTFYVLSLGVDLAGVLTRKVPKATFLSLVKVMHRSSQCSCALLAVCSVIIYNLLVPL